MWETELCQEQHLKKNCFEESHGDLWCISAFTRESCCSALRRRVSAQLLHLLSNAGLLLRELQLIHGLKTASKKEKGAKPKSRSAGDALWNFLILSTVLDISDPLLVFSRRQRVCACVCLSSTECKRWGYGHKMSGSGSGASLCSVSSSDTEERGSSLRDHLVRVLTFHFPCSAEHWNQMTLMIPPLLLSPPFRRSTIRECGLKWLLHIFMQSIL